jgi:hypothetical protein
MLIRASIAENACSACSTALTTISVSGVDCGGSGSAESSAAGRGVENLLRRYLALLAGELIAAAPPARPFQNALSHKCLQHALQMPAREPAACGKRFG